VRIFKPANILIPAVNDLRAWSVVACDQFTSDPKYWQQVEEAVGNSPSALRMIIPEAKLSEINTDEESKKINATMAEYLSDGIFDENRDAYVLVERTDSKGRLRRGIVGMIDLEQYDWIEGSATPIRATEHTVEDRLPPRVKVRESALIEMPHIMLFIDDPHNNVIEKAEKGELLYDFELMQGGGHIKGWLAKDAEAVSQSFEQLEDAETIIEKYGVVQSPVIFAMGDGNHSIAAAKKYWNSVKSGLTAEEAEKHPARYALAEVLNIHDTAVEFLPIHKVVFNTDAESFISSAKQYLNICESGNREITLITEKGSETLKTSGYTIGEMIDSCERFCAEYVKEHGGYIDYIHGDEECVGFASKHGNAGILLPRMEKSELFTSVMKSGPFPKKSFSIGEGRDKRYYLECRKIK